MSFGAAPYFPAYVGGGDLWGEPDPPEDRWWHPIVRFLHGVWLVVTLQWWKL